MHTQTAHVSVMQWPQGTGTLMAVGVRQEEEKLLDIKQSQGCTVQQRKCSH